MEMNKHKIVGSMWYNRIGIVTVDHGDGNIQTYIGVGLGQDQQADEQYIANWGNKFYAEMVVVDIENAIKRAMGETGE